MSKVCLPRPGHETPERIEYAHQKGFRLEQRFRADIEGRISVLKRARRLDRCLDESEAGFEKWIGLSACVHAQAGWDCIVNNLALIAQAMLTPRRRRPVASK